MKSYRVVLTVEVDEEYVRDAGVGTLAEERPLDFIIERIEYDNYYENPTGYEVKSAAIEFSEE